MLKNIFEKLERIISLNNDSKQENLNQSNVQIETNIQDFKKVLNSDYNDVIKKFKDSYYYSLRDVSDIFKNDNFIVIMALDKSLTDMQFVGDELIQNTNSMQTIFKDLQNKDSEKLKIKPYDLEAGAGTTIVIKTVQYEHIDGLNKLLQNEDYKKEFNKLYPERAEKKYPEQAVDIHFLENNKDVYIKLYDAVSNTLENKTQVKASNKYSI